MRRPFDVTIMLALRPVYTGILPSVPCIYEDLNFNHATGYDHLAIPGLKLIHVSKTGPWQSSEDTIAWEDNHISHRMMWYEITSSCPPLLTGRCGGVITHPCRFRYTCVWTYIALRTFHVRTMTTERVIWMHMDITSHRSLWWCCGGAITYPCVPKHNALGNYRHFNFRTNILVYIHIQIIPNHTGKLPWATKNQMAKMTWMKWYIFIYRHRYHM